MAQATFSSLLKEWRQYRRMSQLETSSVAGMSQRHISFLETGRARPSRGAVLNLADALDVPLRERNALLESAGFAPMYDNSPLTNECTPRFMRALEATLAHHEPFPALVLDGRWNLVMSNQAALKFFGLFCDPLAALRDVGAPDAFQLVRLCMAEQGLRPYIENWEELMSTFLVRARRAIGFNPRDALLPTLVAEILNHPDAPDAWRQPELTTPLEPAIGMVMVKDDMRASLISMHAHFGAPQHVSVEELSVETFFPADDTTEALLRDLARD